MPTIPGVPTLDPVSLPSESPGEAAKPGQALSQLGAESSDIAGMGLDFDLFLKKAQQHVDSLAAQNDLARVYADTQNQLAKTQNSRDVSGVIQDARKQLNQVSARWSTSPASVEIQMNADALLPDLSRIGTVRQVDLMSKEFKITVDQQAEVLAGSYAADRAAGGKGDAALGAFATALDGGVKTGLIGDAEAQETLRQFRQKGQELQIKNAITNASPEMNQKIYDQINQHRDDFPDVTQDALDTYKGQALSAFEAHTRQQEWAEGQMAQNTMLRPLIDQHTNPATKQFDLEAAQSDIAQQFKDGKITVTQQDVLDKGVKAYQADLQTGIDKQADKTKDTILDLFHDRKYSEASDALEKARPWLEQNGNAALYEGLLKYGDSMRRSDRAEAREEYTIGRDIDQEQSYATLGQLQLAMSEGYVFTDSQILNLVGKGKGKMEAAQANEALKMWKSYASDPRYAAALDYMQQSFTVPKTATADEQGRAYAEYARTIAAWRDRVNSNPNEDKVQAAKEVMAPAIQQQIGNQINQIFGTPPKTLGQRTRDFFGSIFVPSPGSLGAAKDDAARAKQGGQPSAPTGTIHVREKASGRTGTIPASEYDPNLYDKVQ